MNQGHQQPDDRASDPAIRRALQIRSIALALVAGNETAVTERVLEIAFQVAKGA